MVNGADGLHKRLAWLPNSGCADRDYEVRLAIDQVRTNPDLPIDWIEKDLDTLNKSFSSKAAKKTAATSAAAFIVSFDGSLYLPETPKDAASAHCYITEQLERKFA